MMAALHSQVTALPNAPQSGPKPCHAAAQTDFGSLLNIASVSADVAEVLPIKTAEQLEDIRVSLAAIMPLLPAPNGALASDDEPLEGSSCFTSSENDQVAEPVAASVPAMMLPFVPKFAPLVSVDLVAQANARDKPETAVPIAFSPKTVAPVGDLASVIQTATSGATATSAQVFPVISGNILAENTQQIFADRQLDLARDHLWLDQLASDIVAAREANDKVSFRLLPPRLGQLDVDILASDAGLSVNLTATTQEAAKIVAAAQPRLIEELRTQGMRVSSAEITCRDMAQQSGQQSRSGSHQTPIVAVPAATELSDTETARPAGRFA